MTEVETEVYEAVPMQMPLDGSRAAVLSEILRKASRVESAFENAKDGCPGICLDDLPVEVMCPECQKRMRNVAAALLKPDALVWEIWNMGEEMPKIAGIIRFSDVKVGENAVAHYVFFDGNLRGKTGVMQEVIRWAFSDRPNWKALRRLTIEVPDYAFALARHASRKLGFGGPFRFRLPQGLVLNVEGVRPGAFVWKGERHDMLVLGLANPDAA